MGYSMRSEFEGTAREAAEYHGIPVEVFLNMITAESNWDSDVIYGNTSSPAGAQGIAQFMPATAAEQGVNPLDPVDALWGAARYTRHLMDYFGGDVRKGVAAYNGGAGNIERGYYPQETMTYLDRVFGGLNVGANWGEVYGGGEERYESFDRNRVPAPNPADYWIQERDESGNPVGPAYFDHAGYADALDAYQAIISGNAGQGLHQSEIDNYYSLIESRKQQSAVAWGNLSARYAELGESGRQFDVSHGENVRQFDVTHGENVRQFNVSEQRMRRAQEFEERSARANAMIDEIDTRIRAGELTLNQAVAEFNRRFNTADLQASIMRDFAPIGVPAGTEYLPGFEAGGPVAQLYGMAGAEYTPTKISTIGVDPMVIAQNILDQSHSAFEAASRAVVTPQQVQTGFQNALGELGMVAESQPWPAL